MKNWIITQGSQHTFLPFGITLHHKCRDGTGPTLCYYKGDWEGYECPHCKTQITFKEVHRLKENDNASNV